MRYILGVDFDNTLVNYDDVLRQTAGRMGFITGGVIRHKKNIRDAIRQLPDGERKWQQVQAHVYGRAMDQATLINGVPEFFRACRRDNVPVYIVSHKTQFAVQDTDTIDLRRTTLEWMTQKGFFESQGLGFSTDRIFFESTRRDKVRRIEELGCTHFIDDLEETFGEKIFPKDIQKILYAPGAKGSLHRDITLMKNWGEIHDYFFGRRR